MHLHTLIKLLFLVIPFIGRATILENPFLNGGELLEVNGYSTLTYKKYDSSDNLESSGSVRGTLFSQEDFYGEEIKTFKMNTSETPIGGTPVATEMYEIYIDDDFAFNNTVSSLKYMSSVLNRSVGKPPASQSVSIGQTWKNIAYRTGFTEVSGQQGQIITLPIRIVIEGESKFLGIESISTVWGAKKAIVIETQNLIQSGNQEWVDGFYKYTNAYADTQQVKKDYYLKGVGLYKFSTLTNASSYTTTAIYTPNNSSQTFTYPRPQSTENFTYEYSTRNLSPTDFSELSQTSGNSSSISLNSWTWNGSFPWVYSHANSSWFYYSFSGNRYNVYDAKNNSWYTFNDADKTWTFAVSAN